ncbi:MAG: amino acid permease [Anaerolineae bacterium]
MDADRLEATLTRDLGLVDVTLIGMGAMIGAGIFVLTGIAAGEAGPALLLAFALNGIVTLFTAASYAELGSTYPSAGGSYDWIKQALPGPLGFLSGWMNWFAASVACSLYALGFGAFAARLLTILGFSHPALGEGNLALGLAALVATVFTFINYRGSSETASVGNVVTLAKVTILAALVLFGLAALRHRPDWPAQLQPFLPKGMGGVLGAMGLTFIAFEGYEIITHSGEEVIDPRRAIPRAIFLSIGIVVVIYLTVAFVVLAATDAAGVPTWQFLGNNAEQAMVEAAASIMPFGSLVLLVGGLMSTMSALNATFYASSRVSFAMGRDRNLPSVFGRVHPRLRTPHGAILISGALIVLMALLLPIKDVASAASIMFLLLFGLVNAALISLRRREKVARGFTVPLVPLLPVLGIVSQGFLALFLFRLSPVAWYTTLLWIAGGILFYAVYASRTEAMEEPLVILHEEIVAVKQFSVLLPVANEEQARLLSIVGGAVAREHDGEVLALHVVRVPVQLALADGRHLMRQAKPIMETVITQSKSIDVPVHTMIRVGRSIARAIIDTAHRRDSNLILLGWPGYTESRDRAFGSVIDLVSQNPPCDLAVIRFRKRERPQRILVPSAGGPNASLAMELAIAQARQYQRETEEFPEITALYVARPGVAGRLEAGDKLLKRFAAGFDHPIRTKVIEDPDVANGILGELETHNLLILGATEEGLFEQRLFGGLPERIARLSPKTVVMAKRHRGPVRSLLRRIVL